MYQFRRLVSTSTTVYGAFVRTVWTLVQVTFVKPGEYWSTRQHLPKHGVKLRLRKVIRGPEVSMDRSYTHHATLRPLRITNTAVTFQTVSLPERNVLKALVFVCILSTFCGSMSLWTVERKLD
ncbi:hypothetical protein RRG08_005830 [Elysia crispata]|uniref:Uncharacterized protein n=1 Tax=Elysia crispata TaxID=231223 RepID=A0AAE0YDI9_9GAST|nr:hypothetical protein RRG08_005830 [Elysia crispata]